MNNSLFQLHCILPFVIFSACQNVIYPFQACLTQKMDYYYYHYYYYNLLRLSGFCPGLHG